MADKPTTVEQYFAALLPEQSAELEQVRAAIHRGIPGATERIAYGMPCVELSGQPNLHFAAWNDHIGVYPVLAGSLPEELSSRVEPYRKSKGTLSFPYEQGVPLDLIEEIARALQSRGTS